MNQGVVKFFNESKGFGFIRGEDKDYFVHISNLNGNVINEGDNVEFEIMQGKKGEEATNVNIL